MWTLFKRKQYSRELSDVCAVLNGHNFSRSHLLDGVIHGIIMHASDEWFHSH